MGCLSAKSDSIEQHLLLSSKNSAPEKVFEEEVKEVQPKEEKYDTIAAKVQAPLEDFKVIGYIN